MHRYEVQTLNLKPFKEGQSGNPGGKPKAPTEIMRSVRTLAGLHSTQAIQVLIDIMNDRKCTVNSRVTAATAILDRAIGKPKEFLEITKTNPFDEMTIQQIMGMVDNIKMARAEEAQPVIENND